MGLEYGTIETISQTSVCEGNCNNRFVYEPPEITGSVVNNWFIAEEIGLNIDLLVNCICGLPNDVCLR